jgi:putative transposase
VRFEHVHAEKARHSVSALCRALRVSTSGYYAWRGRGASHRAREDAVLGVHIRAIHKQSRRTYGSPRVHAQLGREGWRVGRKRVARIMREEGVQAEPRRRFRTTTDSRHSLPVAANVLERRFDAADPDRVWATDITYVWTWQGWLYLAVVVDLFSRRVVGWAADGHMRTELVLNALAMAIARRRPAPGLVHHSDRGSQYASHRYQQELARHGMVPSMSRKGNCWDNAVAESFFGSIKTELIHTRPWATRAGARGAIAEYIELFYNSQRLHSRLGYASPAEYERAFAARAALAA